MSFSGDVRRELTGHIPKARHCLAAQLRAVLVMCGGVVISGSDRVSIRVRTENIHAAVSFCEIVRKLIKRSCEVRVRANPSGGRLYYAAVATHEDALLLLEEAGLSPVLSGTGSEPETETAAASGSGTGAVSGSEPETAAAAASGSETAAASGSGTAVASGSGTAAASGSPPRLRECCAKAYLRGCFIAAGSVSDPKRSYHLEITCDDREKAQFVQAQMRRFSLDGRIVMRKGKHIVYLKEAEQIVTLLALMEAPKGLMELENVRILREITGDVNRRVNCETANINKTVEAAVRQAEDIRYIAENIGLAALPYGLAEVAELRLENPDAPLHVLGQMLDPPVGKSGVNHRLRKISAIAQKLRDQDGSSQTKGRDER